MPVPSFRAAPFRWTSNLYALNRSIGPLTRTGFPDLVATLNLGNTAHHVQVGGLLRSIEGCCNDRSNVIPDITDFIDGQGIFVLSHRNDSILIPGNVFSANGTLHSNHFHRC